MARSPVIVTVHVVVVAGHCVAVTPPLQPLKTEPEVAVAVSVTEVPVRYGAEQVPVCVPDASLQLISLRLSDTDPEVFVVAPFNVTVSWNDRTAPARNTSAKPLLSRVTRLLAEEMKLTVRPSPLTDGTMVSPFAGGGDVPAGWLARNVSGVQVAVLASPWHVFRE